MRVLKCQINTSIYKKKVFLHPTKFVERVLKYSYLISIFFFFYLCSVLQPFCVNHFISISSHFSTADFIKKVLSVYTNSMTTIYLSLSTQVAKSTFFMKSPVALAHLLNSTEKTHRLPKDLNFLSIVARNVSQNGHIPWVLPH